MEIPLTMSVFVKTRYSLKSYIVLFYFECYIYFLTFYNNVVNLCYILIHMYIVKSHV